MCVIQSVISLPDVLKKSGGCLYTVRALFMNEQLLCMTWEKWSKLSNTERKSLKIRRDRTVVNTKKATCLTGRLKRQT